MGGYFADDRFIIPDYIRKMSREELEPEIARLEREEQEKRDRKQKEVAAV